MSHTPNFFLGAYYLIKWKPRISGTNPVFTASTCFNDSLLDTWSYSWTTGNDDSIAEIKDKFQLDDERIQDIREWVDRAFNAKRIGWPNVFYDLETVQEYGNTFFPQISDKQLVSIYFPEKEAAALLVDFRPDKEIVGSIGLFDALQKQIPETLSNNETFIGFDLIWIEPSGDFYSFFCHDLASDLCERLQLRTNQYGLFKDSPDWEKAVNYLNEDSSGFEPVTWFVCKVKLVS